MFAVGLLKEHSWTGPSTRGIDGLGPPLATAGVVFMCLRETGMRACDLSKIVDATSLNETIGGGEGGGGRIGDVKGRRPPQLSHHAPAAKPGLLSQWSCACRAGAAFRIPLVKTVYE